MNNLEKSLKSEIWKTEFSLSDQIKELNEKIDGLKVPKVEESLKGKSEEVFHF